MGFPSVPNFRNWFSAQGLLSFFNYFAQDLPKWAKKVDQWIGTIPTAGMGDVNGPSSAVSGDIAVFSGTTGKLIADSGFKPNDLINKVAVGQVVLLNTATNPGTLLGYGTWTQIAKSKNIRGHS